MENQYNKEIHPKVLEFLDELYDRINDELSFEDSLHGLRRHDYEKYVSDISSFVEQYNDFIDMIKFFSIDVNSKELPNDTAIIDYHSSCESETQLIMAIQEFKKVNLDETLFRKNCSRLYLRLLDSKIDLKEHTEYFKNVNNYDNFIKSTQKFFLELNMKPIIDTFNSNNYKLHPLYRKIHTFLKQEIEDSLNIDTIKEMNYNTRFYNFNTIYKRYISVVEPYLNYYNLFKHLNKLPDTDNNKFDLNKFNSIEEIYDSVIDSIEKSELKKYMKYFLGSYIRLADEDTDKLFSTLKYEKYNKDTIKTALKNIALFDDSQILNLTLQNLIDKNLPSSNDILESISENPDINSDILFNSNNILALRINDFKTSTILAKNSWCISKSQSFYDSYIKDPDYYHVFIYNFSKDIKHPHYKIGITFSGHDIYKSFDNTNSPCDRESIYKMFGKEKIDIIQKSNKEIKIVNEIIKSENLIFSVPQEINDLLYFLNRAANKIVSHSILNLDLKNIQFNSNLLSKNDQFETYLTICKKLEVHPFENIYFKTEYTNLKDLQKIILNKQYNLTNQDNNIINTSNNRKNKL